MTAREWARAGKLRTAARRNKADLYLTQNGKCAGCRLFFAERRLTVHHGLPISLGGKSNLENLSLLCRECHIRADKVAFAAELRAQKGKP